MFQASHSANLIAPLFPMTVKGESDGPAFAASALAGREEEPKAPAILMLLASVEI